MSATHLLVAEGRSAAIALNLLAAAALSLALVSCGGGGSGDEPLPPPAVTVGAAGGAVGEAGGAQVVVPAGALQADTTIRLAKDSSGAPPVPAGLVAAGDTYAITPHGTRFAQPVEVRLPVPSTSLQPNQNWSLAKAEPGGSWVVLGNSTVADGMVSARVGGFSYFTVVAVSYPFDGNPPQLFGIFKWEHRCNGEPCGTITLPTSLEIRVTTTGGVMPAVCSGASQRSLDIYFTGGYQPDFPERNPLTSFELTSQTVYTTVVLAVPTLPNVAVPAMDLFCDGQLAATYFPGPALLFDSSVISHPDRALTRPLRVLSTPGTVQTLVGARLDVPTVMSGGAAQADPIAAFRLKYTPPDARNQAVITWLRSRDAGKTWVDVGRSFQSEADAHPLEGPMPAWMYWTPRFSYGPVEANDDGALIRAQACYTPPGSSTPECVTGSPTRVEVIQQGAVPRFTEAPRSMLVRTGQTASLSATVTGLPTPTLQWQTRPANASGAWTDVSGATSTSFTTALLGLADNGTQFRLVATNALGTAESAPVTVSVSDLNVAPTFTTQPASLSVASGSDAAFAVAARGTEALNYQWHLNGNPIAGANAAVLRLPAVTPAQAGTYSVVVSNAAGSTTSADAMLTVGPAGAPLVAPSIVTQPASVLVNAGNTATFGVGVSGSAPFTFQWLRNAQPIAGATQAVYSIASATSVDAAIYSVQVSNAAGSAVSFRVQLTVTPAPRIEAVTLMAHPAPQVQSPGGTASFVVAASGTGPLSYQWLKDGTPIAGATGAVLTLGNLGTADIAAYSVTVGNVLGGITSDAAPLTLLNAPVIVAPPQAARAAVGGTARFSVTASGSGLRYQWLRNNVAIPGADSASYTTPALAPADSGAIYAVLVYNGAGVVFSTPAVLSMESPPAASPSRDKIASSFWHTCAMQADGQAACWGYNSSGQVGAGDTTPWPVPRAMTLLEPATGVAAGETTSCALTVTGKVYCAGNGFTSPQPLSGFTNVKQVVAGRSHRCLLASDDTVWCWGSNDVGQVGDGTTDPRLAPVQVANLSGMLSVAAGADFSCALRNDDSVWCWGLNTSGQVGQGPSPSVSIPVQVSVGPATQVSLGAGYACALLRGGTVNCWGRNNEGQLGTGSVGAGGPAAVAVIGLSRVVEVTAGRSHVCARLDDLSVRCWGTGVMGNGNVDETRTAPTQVGGLAGVQALAAGFGHTCALRSDGQVLCWGGNQEGQLGVGDRVVRTVPTVTVAGAIFWRP
ncbi:immunoglobulin I-set domain-containing protein [Burkholderiales bacterium JOSHI_001]|nr:immunoglobulin I-set domain-containing protein [Burkholderiales bacterium JOSHI_001]